jgi:hypothetical protein
MRPARLAPVVLVLSACGAPVDMAGGSSDGGGSTSVPTSEGGESSGSSGGESSGGEDTGGSTGEPGPEALPPLVDPVVLTDEEVRVPTHAVDAERVLDPRVPADVMQALADGYGEVTLEAGEPVQARTLDDSEPPAPGASPKLLVRFVHLADVQLADDESPSRLASFDQVSGGAFRPEEAYTCRMLNAAARTINRLHVDLPVDFVLLGGDNIDNAQSNELAWFMGILDGDPAVECDSAVDDDPVPGPDNDPKDRFAPVGLDVPWRWVSGNHDTLRQGNWPVADWMGEPIGSTAPAGTRDWSLPGGPVVTGEVPADPRRAFQSEAERLQQVADAGDGHGVTAEALALGKATYTFDVEGTPLRFFVLDTSSSTGGSKGLIRQVHVDEVIEPILQQAAIDEKLVIIATHHRADSLADGNDAGVGETFEDAILGPQWVDYLGTHPHVLMHLGAHTHRMTVQARAPMGGHAFWELASPSLQDFPSQLRLVEVWDQDNGFLTFRTVAFDFATEGDPLAEEGRTIAVTDFTAAWSGDGRGTDALQRNVELWISQP